MKVETGGTRGQTWIKMLMKETRDEGRKMTKDKNKTRGEERTEGKS